MKQKWAADKIERRKVGGLIPYARNSRTHSEAQVAQIAASIKEWGWTTPVLIEPNGGIIAGHGRVMAAQKLGIEEVPCIVATGWTDAQRRAYVIADNRLPELAGWDQEMLALELGELGELDFDLSLTGLDGGELCAAMDSEGRLDPDQHASGEPLEPDGEKRQASVFPVLVSLNAAQFKRWAAMKKETGLDDDALFVEVALK